MTNIDNEAALRRALDEIGASSTVRESVLRAAKTGRTSKRHHVVPLGYLEAWTDETGQVGVWDTDLGRSFPANPINVCVESDYYTAELNDGTATRLIEGALAELDARFIGAVREIVQRSGLPTDPTTRIQFSTDIAIQKGRQTQQRRVMAERAERIARAVAGSELEARGLDAFDIHAEIPAGAQAELMFRAAKEVAPHLAAGSWTLHVADKPVFATADVPVLYDYTAPLGREQLLETTAGQELIGGLLDSSIVKQARAGFATAAQVLIPLAPTVLLEIAPDGGGTNKVVAASGRVREVHERLLVRNRERFIIARLGHPLVSGSRPVVKRKRQLRVECVSTSIDGDRGECLQHHTSIYSSGPELRLCGNHA